MTNFTPARAARRKRWRAENGRGNSRFVDADTALRSEVDETGVAHTLDSDAIDSVLDRVTDATCTIS